MDIAAEFPYSSVMANKFPLKVYPILAGLLLLAGGSLQAETLLIRGGTLIDMTGNKPLRNASVLIENDRIKQIWQGDAVNNYPADTQIIDATGRYVMPGLIDSHVHYNWYMGELFLAHGITTVNDLSSRNDWQRAVRNGLNNGGLRGPRYLYCMRVGKGEAAQAKQLVDEVRQLADCIRFDADSPEALTIAVTTAADQAAIGVIAHSYDAVTSARLGIDGVEHLEGVALATIQDERGKAAVAALTLEEGHKNPLLYQYMEADHYDAVIRQLIDAKVFLNPTLVHEWKGVIDRTAQFEQEELQLLGLPTLQYVPQDEKLVSLGQYHWADPVLLHRGSADTVPPLFVNNSYVIHTPTLREQIDNGYRNIQQFLRQFVRAGGKLYSGTDTAAASIPGISLHHEMQLLADAGISNEAVLASSTRWAAEMLHIEDRLGTITPGKIADIIILSANPLEDIANTRKIEQVILAGKPVDITYHADYEFPFHQIGTVSKHLYHQPPVVSTITPGMAHQHSAAVITVTGYNFVPASVVILNGVPVRTDWISPTELHATLGPRETALPGSYRIGVSTPAPGGGRDDPREFVIDYPE